MHEELVSIAAVTSDPRLRERLLALCDRTAPPAARGAVPVLTDRELQVLVAIARGRTNQEVAVDLGIMPTTVKTYVRNTMRKLGAHNGVEIVHLARRAGLLD